MNELKETWPIWARNLHKPWDSMFFGIALWQWIGLAVLGVAAVLAGYAGRWLAVRVISLRSRLLHNALTKSTATSLRRAAGLLLSTSICYPILDELALRPNIDRLCRKGLEGFSIVAVTLLAYALWDGVSDEIAAHSTGSERAEKLLVPMARKFVRAIIVTFAVMVAATKIFGADVRGIIASLGIGGLVVALASKDSVENLFGSLTILFDMPFAIGDWVKIDKAEGIVEEINLRSTRIRTFEDTIITVPNANLIRASVENFSARRSRRQVLTVAISYDTDPDALNAFSVELRRWLDQQPHVMPGKSIVQISNLGEASLHLLVQCQLKAGTRAEELEGRHALAVEILVLREKHGVLFAAAPRPLPPTPPSRPAHPPAFESGKSEAKPPKEE